MTVEIVPYAAHHVAAVQAFNARLRTAGIAYTFPESNLPAWLPPAPAEPLYQEYFVAVEGDVVRGGYILKHQEFAVAGTVMSIGAIQLPLSEGTFDRSYAAIGVQLLRDAIRRQPLLYTLGIGGHSENAARLLNAARFGIEKVPFFFQVEHGANFLRQIQPVRTSRARRLACDIGAATGIGGLAIGLLQRLRTSRKGSRRVDVRELTAFDSTVNEVWDAVRGTFDLGAVRDQRVLARLYDRPGGRFIRIAIHEGGSIRGWAVLLSTAHRRHKYFGDMRVGSIVDLLAVPGYERALIDAAVRRLRSEAVDIIVTNQSLGPVCVGLRTGGFLEGPSNFLFAASPRLMAIVGPLRACLPTFHFDRGDGDGPINL